MWQSVLNWSHCISPSLEESGLWIHKWEHCRNLDDFKWLSVWGWTLFVCYTIACLWFGKRKREVYIGSEKQQGSSWLCWWHVLVSWTICGKVCVRLNFLNLVLSYSELKFRSTSLDPCIHSTTQECSSNQNLYLIRMSFTKLLKDY